ncbi:hypothetical protein MMPV_001437 [Pyropia vietnamensis]
MGPASREITRKQVQRMATKEYLSVGYFSKKLTPAQKNYSVTELEGLGVVWAVTMLRPYLEGAVTTRSGSVLDPRRPEMAGMLPLPLDKLFQAQERDKLCQRIRKEMDKGYEYLLVMCDRFTKLTRVSPLKDTTALDVWAVCSLMVVEADYL